MLQRGILKPVLPEIELGSVQELKKLISAEAEARVGANRLGASPLCYRAIHRPLMRSVRV